MKKLASIICLLFISFVAMAQTDNSVTTLSASLDQLGDNEISINLLSSVAGMPELSYERFITDNMGVGLSASLSLDHNDNIGYNWLLTPYYRLYFGSKKAAGFFVEGSMTLLNQRYNSSYYYYDASNYFSSQSHLASSTNFGLGMAVGVRFLARHGFTGELLIGGGRLFGCDNNDQIGAYPRIGISIGKRF